MRRRGAGALLWPVLLLLLLVCAVGPAGSAWAGGVLRLLLDVLSAQNAAHLVLMHDHATAAAGGVSWPAELQRARIYLTTLHVSEPVDALDRIVTAHSGPTLLVLAAEPHTTLDVVTKLNASGRLNELKIWMVLVNGTQFREQLSSWYLPINNQLLLAELWLSADDLQLSRAELVETYRLSASHPARWEVRGLWDAAAGLRVWDDRSLYERRSDWSGLTLRVAGNLDPPLISYHPGPPGDVGGYVGSVWKILAEILQFNYTAGLSVDGQWGSLQEDGSWSGVVGMLQRRDIDAAVTTLLATPARRRVISFTSGVLTLRYRIFVLQSSSMEYSWTTYVAVFAPSLWAAVVGSVVLAGTAMGVLCKLERRYLPHLTAEGTGGRSMGWADAALFCVSAACQQGSETSPAGLATRLLFWTTYITTVTLSAAYSATLFSSLAVRKYPLPFTDLQGLVRTGSHRLALPDASAQLDFFKFSKIPIIQEAFRNHLWVVPSQTVGMKKLLAGDNVAVLMAYLGPNHQQCGVEDLKQDYMVNQASIGLQMRSPYRPFFNFHLARLWEQGILDQVHRRYLSKPNKSCKKSDAQSLSLSSVFSAFVLLGIGALLSVLSLLAENLYSRCLRK